MSNEKNEEALGRLILAEFKDWADTGYARVDGRMAGRLAKVLASRGCLVPSVLTDSDLETAIHATYFDIKVVAPEDGDAFRSALERIAKGGS